MPRYSVPNKHLKEFSTTKADKKKNLYRIPPEMYKIKEEPTADTASEVSLDGTKATDFSEECKLESKSIYQRNASEKEVVLPDFKIIKGIGKGSFGTIYLVEKHDNRRLYAMKQLRKDVIIKNDALICTKLEKEVLKMAHHPFLVGLDYVFQTTTNIYFVMKYYKGGELYKHLLAKKRFPESEAKFYAAQIALALGELHRKKIIYRDMKPENILLDEDGYIALADFGLAKIVDENRLAMTFCGTPEYIAPETIKGGGYGRSVDWWGLGILLYELIVGVPPFHSSNHHVMFQYITHKELTFPEGARAPQMSDEARDMIVQLLNKNPLKRLGTEKDIDEVMGHPFFKDIDVEKLLSKKLTPAYVPKISENLTVPDEKPKNIEDIDAKSKMFIEKNKVLFSIVMLEIVQ